MRVILYTLLGLLLLGVMAAAGVGFWAYVYLAKDLPNIATIDDYEPAAASNVYADDGTLVGEFFSERRYPVVIDEVPLHVRNAFLASEDENFYGHSGVDPISIIRAGIKNLLYKSKQGGSTITQQVVKNLLLNTEQTIERKVKEAMLAFMLEQRYSKDEIFQMYLNHIFFGNTAYGIKAAARLYFRKELKDLTIAEGAMLAGLPKAPSTYSPVANFERATERQRYVLGRMYEAGFITAEELAQARAEKVKVYPASSQNIFHAPFYVSEVRRILEEKWPTVNVSRDGLQIHTALNIKADQYATKALRAGLREIDKRRGWRGAIDHIAGADVQSYLDRYRGRVPQVLEQGEIYPALVLEVQRTKRSAEVQVGEARHTVSWRTNGWLDKQRSANDRVAFSPFADVVRVGDVLEVIVGDQGAVSIDQTPEIEGAITIMHPETGKVVAVVGGYQFARSKFNRATQGLRQPGSAFKPIVYLAAIDGYGYTPATVVDDSPRTFRVLDQFWSPGNFDGKFLGAMTLQRALEKSRNIVSAELVARIGPDAVIRYARKLGIESKLQRVLSIALGSSEVTPLELTRAYGVFAARGVLMRSTFITKIIDRHGKVIFDADREQLSNATPVISEQSAFIMSHMMRGVVERGTGVRVKALQRPVAGKTGTSNDQMDAWFVGYTPQWVAGVWVGFDTKKEIGEKETGGVIAAPIFVDAMKPWLEDQDREAAQRAHAEAVEQGQEEPRQEEKLEQQLPEAQLDQGKLSPADFVIPEGVSPYWINEDSGEVVSADTPGAVLTYILKGVEIESELKSNSDTSLYLEGE